MALRRLWDGLGLGRWLDRRASDLPGRYRPALTVECWVALLWYGGGWLEDLGWLLRRGVRRLFGWRAVPDPTTFGRWLRRAGEGLVIGLEELIRELVRMRWAGRGIPRSLTLVLDSTVSGRYGRKQAGAQLGYNPKRPGRPSHHPLLAFVAESGDLLGVRWRPGSAHAAQGPAGWLLSRAADFYDPGRFGLKGVVAVVDENPLVRKGLKTGLIS